MWQIMAVGQNVRRAGLNLLMAPDKGLTPARDVGYKCVYD